jgi:hypothetical protein
MSNLAGFSVNKINWPRAEPVESLLDNYHKVSSSALFQDILVDSCMVKLICIDSTNIFWIVHIKIVHLSCARIISIEYNKLYFKWYITYLFFLFWSSNWHFIVIHLSKQLKYVNQYTFYFTIFYKGCIRRTLKHTFYLP